MLRVWAVTAFSPKVAILGAIQLYYLMVGDSVHSDYSALIGIYHQTFLIDSHQS